MARTSENGDKTPTQATCHPSSYESPLSPRRVAARCAIVLALAFNVLGPADAYDALRSTTKWLHAVDKTSELQIAWDIAIYICSGVILAITYHISIQQMTFSADGVESRLQRSKLLRYACITVLGFWSTRSVTVRDLVQLVEYGSHQSVGLMWALYKLCGTVTFIVVMGRIWYNAIVRAYQPPRRRAVSLQTQEKAQPIDMD